MTSSSRQRKVMSALSKTVVFKRFGLWRWQDSWKYQTITQCEETTAESHKHVIYVLSTSSLPISCSTELPVGWASSNRKPPWSNGCRSGMAESHCVPMWHSGPRRTHVVLDSMLQQAAMQPSHWPSVIYQVSMVGWYLTCKQCFYSRAQHLSQTPHNMWHA